MTWKKILSSTLLASTLMFGANVDAAKFEPPELTAEFDQMDFMQLYPTFSWDPVKLTEFYQVQVVKVDTGEVVRDLKNLFALNRVTDDSPFNETGEYFWQVRVIDKKGRPLSDWSTKKFFTVTAPVEVAVLGDSISHGGAAYIPAGQLSCQWETYCPVPVKNLAQSGNTTEMMIERFERDVLPFKPKILLIMGGINDIRTGSDADTVIKNLETLREKCLANSITPVFITLTPMNPEIMRNRKIPLTDGDWFAERDKINAWIMRTPNFINLGDALNDEQGYLRAELTPDGLHPAQRGKMIIGKIIGDYLQTSPLSKNV